jgi:predicted  nucleic acid-binding Zn-ribbon protein
MQDPGNHPTHQVSDADKAAVSKESREAAAAMAREAFEKRLQEISMGKNDYQMYQQYLHNIALQVAQLKEILSDISSRGKERVWLRNQSQGNLDDSKLVDGLSGERLVFKRRGYSGACRVVSYLLLVSL